jgi:hypothetical protein
MMLESGDPFHPGGWRSVLWITFYVLFLHVFWFFAVFGLIGIDCFTWPTLLLAVLLGLVMLTRGVRLLRCRVKERNARAG